MKYYSVEKEEALRALNTSENGLSSDKVAQTRAHEGENKLRAP